eukprot:Phypoly_transcript_19408.p1 GENE.Phypoly_transcript_19408~~Phypoly_transcript_19408.p1  ORF type:complete len:116 (+),score=12.51 Phypoly_transcript_19408:323-670(+)
MVHVTHKRAHLSLAKNFYLWECYTHAGAKFPFLNVTHTIFSPLLNELCATLKCPKVTIPTTTNYFVFLGKRETRATKGRQEQPQRKVPHPVKNHKKQQNNKIIFHIIIPEIFQQE